jgi:hypothetical protein
VPHVVRTSSGAEELHRGGDQLTDMIEGARPCGAEEGFEFGEGLFDRIVVGTEGRQEAQLRPDGFDGRANLWM